MPALETIFKMLSSKQTAGSSTDARVSVEEPYVTNVGPENWISERWLQNLIPSRASLVNEGQTKFLLHDMKPVNEDINTVANRILKDIISKFKRQSGFHVPSVSYDPESALRVGIFSERERRHEASVFLCLSKLAKRGLIQRKRKLMPWCTACRTVKTPQQVEKIEVSEPSCFILFPLALSRGLKTELLGDRALDFDDISIITWTTAPWALPCCRALVLHETAEYSLVTLSSGSKQAFIIATERLASFCDVLGNSVVIQLSTCSVDTLINSHIHAVHPLYGTALPLFSHSFVSLKQGTACVLLAPSCSTKDCQIARTYDIEEVRSFFTEEGDYEAHVEGFAGLTLEEGSEKVMRVLGQTGRLVTLDESSSSCVGLKPHCSLCKQKLLFRPTHQWFLEVDGLKGLVSGDCKRMKFIPPSKKASVINSVKWRKDWCISRQCGTGLPFPGVTCTDCRRSFLSSELLTKLAEHMSHGSAFSFSTQSVCNFSLSLFPELDLCCSCGNSGPQRFELSVDILDLSFEMISRCSAISRSLSQDSTNQDQMKPSPHVDNLKVENHIRAPSKNSDVTVFMEGDDELQGCFPSLLFCSAGTHGKLPPNCTFVTLGFGSAESSSKPIPKWSGSNLAYVSQWGADVLRLWVCSLDWKKSCPFPFASCRSAHKEYGLIKTTLKNLVTHLEDFSVDSYQVSLSSMNPIDQGALAELFEFWTTFTRSYESLHFNKVFSLLRNYLKKLRTGYLLNTKPRVSGPTSLAKRSAQTVYHEIFRTVCLGIAPVLPFLAEECYWEYSGNTTHSVHLQPFHQPVNVWRELSSLALQTRHTSQNDSLALLVSSITALDPPKKSKPTRSKKNGSVAVDHNKLLAQVAKKYQQLHLLFYQIASAVNLQWSCGCERYVFPYPTSNSKTTVNRNSNQPEDRKEKGLAKQKIKERLGYGEKTECKGRVGPQLNGNKENLGDKQNIRTQPKKKEKIEEPERPCVDTDVWLDGNKETLVHKQNLEIKKENEKIEEWKAPSFTHEQNLNIKKENGKIEPINNGENSADPQNTEKNEEAEEGEECSVKVHISGECEEGRVLCGMLEVLFPLHSDPIFLNELLHFPARSLSFVFSEPQQLKHQLT